jgi:hypothetical protein
MSLLFLQDEELRGAKALLSSGNFHVTDVIITVTVAVTSASRVSSSP